MEKGKETSSEQDGEAYFEVKKGKRTFPKLFESDSGIKINQDKPSMANILTNRVPPAESKTAITGKKFVLRDSALANNLALIEIVGTAMGFESSYIASLKEELILAERNRYKPNLRKQDEISSLLNNCTLEDDPHLEEAKNKFQQFGFISPEKSLQRPSPKKLLVLNLSGIVLDIVNDFDSAYRVEKRVSGKPIFKRPFCDDFLKFCFEKFNVGLWSSRRNYNVETVVDYVLGKLKHKLLFSWDQSKCTDSGFSPLENPQKPLFLLEMKKLWNKEDVRLPWQKGQFSPSNTLLLVNAPYKALLNPPYTAVFPPVYHYYDVGDNSLGPGGDIRVYLEQLAVTDDVQQYVKEHPFGQPAITASNPNWNFYSQIIRRFTGKSETTVD